LSKKVAVEWKSGPIKGSIKVRNGTLIGSPDFSFKEAERCRLVIEIDNEDVSYSSKATIITLLTERNPFSFFLRDVKKEFPIFIPEYNVIVTEPEDVRSFDDIKEDIINKGLLSKLQLINLEPEEAYEEAEKYTRKLRCPIWLGITRDMRIFEMDFRRHGSIQDYVKPRFHGYDVSLEETNWNPVRYEFFLGRGWGCMENISRRLEEGFLPILRAEILDEDILYDCTAFVTLEKSKLSQENIRGTHFLVADGHGHGHMFTAEQEERFRSLLTEELNQPEETVFCFRAKAVNTSSVPRYAFFKAPYPVSNSQVLYSFDKEEGLGLFNSGRVYCLATLNGAPLIQEEIAYLLNPGESVAFEFFIPHRPISKERALKLRETNFDIKLMECKNFWKNKLETAAQITLPEKRIENMVKAGLLHLDIVTYGLEPDGTVVPTIGVYNAIGSESSPIIQFMDSMGWHNIAKRALMYFIEKQHEDGFMQNFGGYMLETGCVLWSIGEHYRYTHDDEFIKDILPNIIKACKFLLAWRDRNKKEELRGKGYGLMEGKVADPEDQERIFMLNGYAYLGLSRMAEVLNKFDPEFSIYLRKEAEEFKNDIRIAFFEAISTGPVVPLGNGKWVPTVAPWVGQYGPSLLFADGKKCYTHGTFTARDSLLGPLYLVLQEVLDPNEQAVSFMLNYHSELMTIRNVAFSQPYYSPHPYIHLKRDEVKPFLKVYYNGLSSLADRETYTFWEHYFHASPHKTHEEAWFLMQTRWMLYMEEGETLKLLRGIPRRWLGGGALIELKGVKSYFGSISLSVKTDLDCNSIEAEVKCDSGRYPKKIEIRLPHPQKKRPISVSGGTYNSVSETVVVEGFKGQAKIRLDF